MLFEELVSDMVHRTRLIATGALCARLRCTSDLSHLCGGGLNVICHKFIGSLLSGVPYNNIDMIFYMSIWGFAESAGKLMMSNI